MSKRVTTSGYIAAWLVWMIALLVFFKGANVQSTGTSVSAFAATPASTIAWIIAGVAALVMLVMWIGALVALGQQHAWGWFTVVLVLQLIGLGIVGMVAYAVGGPGASTPSYTRPSVT